MKQGKRAPALKSPGSHFRQKWDPSLCTCVIRSSNQSTDLQHSEDILHICAMTLISSGHPAEIGAELSLGPGTQGRLLEAGPPPGDSCTLPQAAAGA